mmetsp:Transcript_7727/g.7145  ORF Transcript_7727/g.7145 Transcript_7727/m.7145 type:complete len:86 (+) Transcript_7727:73-330(+)
MQYPINEEMLKYDEQINSNNFDAFNLHSLTKKNSLYFMLQYMYQKFNFADQLNMNSQKFVKFSLRLQQAYRENPYHSSIHAADVV